MDFYNFENENENEIFYFEKYSETYQPTLKIYRDNYKSSLSLFLSDYVENTELRFIETQLQLCTEEINIQSSAIKDLEILDHETFYYILNRLSTEHVVYKENLFFENEEPCDTERQIDLYSTSKNFIKFISNRITSLSLINDFLEQKKQELGKYKTLISPKVPTLENKLFDTGFNFKNNFDNVSEITIYKYFTKELVDKKYLTIEKLEEYLQFAFQDNKKPVTKFSFDKIKTQREMIHVFYHYYKTIAQKPYSKKRVYLELLTNYFIGYDYKTIQSNFSK